MKLSKPILLGLLLISELAVAQGLRVSPLRLDMSAKTVDGAIELTNLSDKLINVQVNAVSWRQQDNHDVYEATRDLYYSPPIATVAAGSTQRLRLRLRNGADPQLEKTYRVYLQELPDQNIAAGGSADFRVRLGIPVFVAPEAAPEVKFLLTSNYDEQAGKLQVSLTNQGERHIRLPRLELFEAEHINKDRFNGKALAQAASTTSNTIYALPGTTLTWNIADVPLQPIAMRLQTDFNNFNRDVPVSRRGELWLALKAGSHTLSVSGEAAH